MLEWIREYLMKRMQVNRDRGEAKWKARVCPKIRTILDKHTRKVVSVVPVGNGGLSGIPFYSYAIYGINSQDLWGYTLYIPSLPPNFGKAGGRPATAKRRGVREPMKKKKAEVRRRANVNSQPTAWNPQSNGTGMVQRTQFTQLRRVTRSHPDPPPDAASQNVYRELLRHLHNKLKQKMRTICHTMLVL
ncbi:hypothetical protein BUALT_Bualt19G0072300 [Buddleja alternifolia]|uniref:Uncharacterized protein n=1 Tax=Buddleja alternifolia TaxID=168488 RepID=A0AAV6W9F1_9LAMI|nr:hypothetical protein BUALT_Bualt19G0072300 [Buddleja alternifolia]